MKEGAYIFIFFSVNSIWQVIKLVIGLIALFLIIWGGWSGLEIKTFLVDIELYGIERFFRGK